MKIILLDYLSPLVYCNANKRLERRPSLKHDIEEKRPRRLSSIEKRMCHLFTVTTPIRTVNQQVIY
jgi:hypothetical protein